MSFHARIYNWCANHKDGLSIIISSISLFVSFSGFIFAGVQFYEANQTLKATNAYQIQKDARTLATELRGDADFNACFIKYSKDTCFSEVEPRAKLSLYKIYNFYISVFRQVQAKGVNDDFSKSFGKDYCGLLNSYSRIDVALNEIAQQDNDSEFWKMKELWCKK